MGVRLAIDIGGGFVDLVAVDEETGYTSWAKTTVSPENLSTCVKNVFQLSGIDPGLVTQLLHGQTLVINTILQRKGSKVGLITTKGFRDILAIQRSNRRDIFNLRYLKPEPLIPRKLRLEVDERTTADGQILRRVMPDEVRKACQKLFAQGVESVSICFINSYRNPANEMHTQEIVQDFLEALPNKSSLYVCTSNAVAR